MCSPMSYYAIQVGVLSANERSEDKNVTKVLCAAG